jgi:hypothetical protein
MPGLIHKVSETAPLLLMLGIGPKLKGRMQYSVCILGFMALVAITSASVRDDSPIHPDKTAIRGAWVNGINVTVHLRNHRDYPACTGAYAAHAMVTYHDAEHTKINQVMMLRERDIIDPDNPDIDAWPTFHLYSPLPSPASNWFMITDLHYNCPWWYKALPPKLVRFFMTSDNARAIWQATDAPAPIPQ